jgi:hypothetical protein
MHSPLNRHFAGSIKMSVGIAMIRYESYAHAALYPRLRMFGCTCSYAVIVESTIPHLFTLSATAGQA